MTARAREIVRSVSRQSGQSVEALLGDQTARPVAWPRMLCVILVRELEVLTPKYIGYLFNRHHTTIVDGLRRAADFRETAEFRRLEAAVRADLGPAFTSDVSPRERSKPRGRAMPTLAEAMAGEPGYSKSGADLWQPPAIQRPRRVRPMVPRRAKHASGAPSPLPEPEANKIRIINYRTGGEAYVTFENYVRRAGSELSNWRLDQNASPAEISVPPLGRKVAP